MKYHCCEPRRLEVLRHGSTDVNAIELLEVLDRGAPAGVPPQCTLFVRLLRAGVTLDPQRLSISGGERIQNVDILWCGLADALPAAAEPGLAESVAVEARARTLVVRTERSGDFSTYTFAIASDENATPPNRFDPRLSSIGFSFKLECPSPFDCLEPSPCPQELGPPPVIDYLAKDYQGFRRLMLDRLSLLAPAWTERSPADVGVALVELLAYAADNLSYRQDAVSTEAYLETARLRRSVRRHTRLVDYYLHEGANARAFVHFRVQEGVAGLPLSKGTTLLTTTPGLPSALVAQGHAERDRVVRDAVAADAQVFLTAHATTLDARLNQISFYTWGDENCCLPRGSTRATLRTDLAGVLQEGSLLLLEEVLDPQLPDAGPRLANKTHRAVVRLSRVTAASDPSGGLFASTPSDEPLHLTEVEWSAEDALPFALCLSADGVEIAVARGNLVLTDHGWWVEGEDLGKVPPEVLGVVPESVPASCKPMNKGRTPLRFSPALARGPLTHGFDLAALLDERAAGSWRWSASALLELGARTAMPSIALRGDVEQVSLPEDWKPRRDLLDSSASDEHFVVEMEDDGRARLRFGDDVHGKRPNAGTAFFARYRVGNGSIGNVGVEAITHVVGDASGITLVRNPLAAAGGVDPESVDVARRDAPQAFRTQERAVTATDYATLSERLPDVQRATARFRWTGSWHTAFVSADRLGGAPVDGAFAARLRHHLERFRMAGYDLHADSPRYVPLDVALFVCVAAGQPRSAVLREVKGVLSSGVLPDGRLGLFHPDRFTFGNPVYLSQIISAAHAVTGVDSVRVDRFQRLTNPDPASLAEGVIPIGPLEIAQLENSPSFPERGKLKLVAGGGT